MQSHFYTKLAEQRGKGYCYKDVRRWTNKAGPDHSAVDIFTKNLVVIPIHCHGNHWTLAVVNFDEMRFECAARRTPTCDALVARLWRAGHASADAPQHGTCPTWQEL